MKTKTIALGAVLFLVITVSAFAGGGGGMLWQYQSENYPFIPDWHPDQNSRDLKMVGGYGYGVDRHGRIHGGYGFGIVSEDDGPGTVRGGFGGVISGFQILPRPIHLAVVSYVGVGGLSVQGSGGASDLESWFALSAELDVEVGLPLMGWFMPVVYAGYQYMGNLIPGESFEVFSSYSPVLGFRLAFGDF